MARRPRPPEDVYFPVVPMLDMAFQLLAFFILTFQAPSRETRLDLELPASPLALPGRPPSRESNRMSPPTEEIGLETDLVVVAQADEAGRLRSLRLGATPLPDPAALADRLQRYAEVMEDHPIRVTLSADDHLLYDDAAKLIGAISSSGTATIHLAGPPAGGRP